MALGSIEIITSRSQFAAEGFGVPFTQDGALENAIDSKAILSLCKKLQEKYRDEGKINRYHLNLHPQAQADPRIQISNFLRYDVENVRHTRPWQICVRLVTGNFAPQKMLEELYSEGVIEPETDM